ncbi:MAG: hypothetical protein AAB229_04550 [Candidatus Hydrogenedentota bacterium]
MVAILVILTFLGFIVLDIAIHRRKVEQHAGIPIRADRFPAPTQGTFVTSNHLTGLLALNGLIVLRPDSFLATAAGPDASFAPVESGTRLRAGKPLYTLRTQRHTLRIGAPCDGSVVSTNGDAVIFEADDLSGALRRMQIGGMMRKWWDAERERLGIFLAGTRDHVGAMADGGNLQSGFLDALTDAEAAEYSRLFLDPGKR